MTAHTLLTLFAFAAVLCGAVWAMLTVAALQRGERFGAALRFVVSATSFAASLFIITL